MSRLLTWPLVAVAASALALTACSNSPTRPQAATATTSTTPAAVSPGASAGGATTIASIPVQDRSPAGTSGTAPTVVVPTSAPPTQLESADLITGTGKAAADGDSITVQYVLATYSTHKVVQSSWTSQPFGFTLGEGQVIKGWDEGVVGMKVGGRRELVIPAELGYGTKGSSSIPANETLVFVIDLLGT